MALASPICGIIYGEKGNACRIDPRIYSATVQNNLKYILQHSAYAESKPKKKLVVRVGPHNDDHHAPA